MFSLVAVNSADVVVRCAIDLASSPASSALTPSNSYSDGDVVALWSALHGGLCVSTDATPIDAGAAQKTAFKRDSPTV